MLNNQLLMSSNSAAFAYNVFITTRHINLMWIVNTTKKGHRSYEASSIDFNRLYVYFYSKSLETNLTKEQKRSVDHSTALKDHPLTTPMPTRDNQLHVLYLQQKNKQKSSQWRHFPFFLVAKMLKSQFLLWKVQQPLKFSVSLYFSLMLYFFS